MEFDTLQAARGIVTELESITMALRIIACGGCAISAFMLILIGAVVEAGKEAGKRDPKC